MIEIKFSKDCLVVSSIFGFPLNDSKLFYKDIKDEQLNKTSYTSYKFEYIINNIENSKEFNEWTTETCYKNSLVIKNWFKVNNYVYRLYIELVDGEINGWIDQINYLDKVEFNSNIIEIKVSQNKNE